MNGDQSIYDILSRAVLPEEVNQYIENYTKDGGSIHEVTLNGLKYRLFLVTTIGQFLDMGCRTIFYLRQFIIETGNHLYFKRSEYYKDYNESIATVFILYLIKVMSICYEIISGVGYSMMICSLTGEGFFRDPLKAALRVRCLYDQLNEKTFFAWDKPPVPAPSPGILLIDEDDGRTTGPFSSEWIKQWFASKPITKCMGTPFSADGFLENSLFIRHRSAPISGGSPEGLSLLIDSQQ